MCFCHHCLLEWHIQNMHENNVFQFFSHCKNFISFLNFHEFLMKQVFKVLNYFAEAFLSFIFLVCICKSHHICTEQHVFFILIFTAHSFYLCHHNNEIVEFQFELNLVRILFWCVDKLISLKQNIIIFFIIVFYIFIFLYFIIIFYIFIILIFIIII